MLKSQTYIMGNHPQFLFFFWIILPVFPLPIPIKSTTPPPPPDYISLIHVCAVFCCCCIYCLRIFSSFQDKLFFFIVFVILLSFVSNYYLIIVSHCVMYYIPNLFHSVSLSYNDFGSFLSAHTQAGESHCWHHLHICKKLDWT